MVESSPAKSMRRQRLRPWRNRPRLTLLTVLLLLPLCFALIFLGSEKGRETLTHAGLAAARHYLPDLEIHEEGVRSPQWGKWYFELLRVRYKERTLLEGQKLTLYVDLWSLLRKQVHIPEVTAEKLLFDNTVLQAYLQQHAGEGDDVPSTQSGEISIPAIWLEKLAINRLTIIDEAVEGLPTVRVDGRASYQWPGEPSALSLEVAEHQGHQLHLRLDGQMISEQQYRLTLSASELSGGFLGRSLHLPDGEALDAKGRVILQVRDESNAQVTVEQFSLPLVNHRFGLQGTAELALSPWSVATRDLTLRVDDTYHTVRGEVDAESVDLKVRLNRLPVAISQPFQSFLEGGWLSAKLDIQGPLKLPNANGTLELRSTFQSQPLRFNGEVETIEDDIHIRSAQLSLADAKAAVAGVVDVEGKSIDVEASLEQLSIDEVREILGGIEQAQNVAIPDGIAGTVEQLRVTAKGPWDNPNLAAEVTSALQYRSFEVDAQAHASGNLENFAVQDLLLEGEGLRVSGSGEVAVESKTLQFQLDVAARGLQPAEQFNVPVDPGTRVDLDAVVSVTGPWANPKMSARITSDGEYRDYRYRLRGGAAGNLDAITFDRLRLDLFSSSAGLPRRSNQQSLRAGEVIDPDEEYPLRQSAERVVGTRALARDAERARAEGSAWLELNGVLEPKAQQVNGSVAGRNIPIGLAKLVGVPLPLSLSGELSLDGNFTGPFTSLEASVNVLGMGEFQGEPWQAQGDVSYGQAAITLSEVKLLWADRNQLNIDGAMSASGLDLQVNAQAVLADFNTWLKADISDTGELSLRATASGTPRNPDLSGELRITGQAPALQDDALVQVPVILSLTWETVAKDLKMQLGASHGSRQAANARASLAIAPILTQLFSDKTAAERPPLPIDFEAGGSADLAALSVLYDPEIHTLRGNLNFDLSARGTSRKPNLRGNINLRDGYYEHRPSNTRLRRVAFIAELTPGAWRIVEASARDRDRGRVDLTGAARFNAPEPATLDFTLSARRARLLNMPGAKGAINGDLRLSGSTEDALLAGTINLRPLTVQVEHFIGSSVPEIDVIEVEVDGGEDASTGSRLLENIGLQIEVVLDQQSVVRGLGLDSQLKGEVDISGTAASPEAAGTITIVRGKFDLLGKKFDLQEGEVQFENNVAAIYVKGVHTYTEGEITAEISGTTDDPKIEFSSNPAAAQDEIFAQLLFGKSLTDISPLQAVRLVSVVRALQTGGTGFDPLASTRDLVGLDTLDFDSEATDEGDQYSLSLGKYITSRIYLELQRSTDPLNPWQAEMQIELRKNLRLDIKSSDGSENGAGSVELQWKKDY
ncbi:translocation/assembly module TamB domain-containing protein [Microbulbifer agarilyticus]|uniref:translocation/assembly module TamB domain-containing protein n=1 Tax=Microbulbifer agarilyticus TaxID=260552 RepID=UPI001CD72AC7|nr:translocation/assembly module TamB [Microbulbifer agarilyticus]MCA0901955.1 translocation/assembly module TamB [Microbulbifer agarilyticus]